ncbi:MAG: hypothetical protein WD065_08300 [Planctomycetaceae bacterium]
MSTPIDQSVRSANSPTPREVSRGLATYAFYILSLLAAYVISIGPMYWLSSYGVFGAGPISWLAYA